LTASRLRRWNLAVWVRSNSRVDWFENAEIVGVLRHCWFRAVLEVVMLGYRTLFTVHADSEAALSTAVSEFRHWLRNKSRVKYDGDALEFGVPLRIGPTARAVLVQEHQPDGFHAVRATLTEDNEAGTWTTTLTAGAPRDGYPWIALDVDGPETKADGSGRRQWTSTPNLARSMLGVFDAYDGLAPLRSRPERAFLDDVPRIIDMVCDPDRRGMFFLAGSDETTGFAYWLEQTAGLLTDTVGLAGSYVLDPDATVEFARAVGESHEVPPNTVRTFMPGADPASVMDARRHRILGADRLASSNPTNLRRMLGWRARETALEHPLPRTALRAGARLDVVINDILVAALAVPISEPVQEPVARAAVESNLVRIDYVSELEIAQLITEVELLTGFAALFTRATGRETSAEDLLDDLARLATLANSAVIVTQAREALSVRLNKLTNDLLALLEQVGVLHHTLEDYQLDAAESADELARVTASRDLLRVKLMEVGEGAQAWSDEVMNPEVNRPDSISALFERLPELTHVTFTGDREVAMGLEQSEPLGAWAGKTWDAMCAAEDYAKAKAAGDWQGNLDAYLVSPPSGYRGFSQRRHAIGESEGVRNHDRLRNARVLPVPRTIDPEGRVFMGAHFKIAQAGLTSPRLHYFDATAIDGRIYFGYLGPHLPTPKTN
jgi:hypothetical protein